jgi:hypothetical protein
MIQDMATFVAPLTLLLGAGLFAAGSNGRASPTVACGIVNKLLNVKLTNQSLS